MRPTSPRAGPVWLEVPQITSSTSAVFSLLRSAIAFSTVAPTCCGWISASAPLPILPTPRGLRQASMIQASVMAVLFGRKRSGIGPRPERYTTCPRVRRKAVASGACTAASAVAGSQQPFARPEGRRRRERHPDDGEAGVLGQLEWPDGADDAVVGHRRAQRDAVAEEQRPPRPGRAASERERGDRDRR